MSRKNTFFTGSLGIAVIGILCFSRGVYEPILCIITFFENLSAVQFSVSIYIDYLGGLILAIFPVATYSNAKIHNKNIRTVNKGKSGIYRFSNLLNGKSYVGSAVDLSKRLSTYYSKKYMETILTRSIEIKTIGLTTSIINFFLKENKMLGCAPKKTNLPSMETVSNGSPSGNGGKKSKVIQFLLRFKDNLKRKFTIRNFIKSLFIISVMLIAKSLLLNYFPIFIVSFPIIYHSIVTLLRWIIEALTDSSDIGQKITLGSKEDYVTSRPADSRNDLTLKKEAAEEFRVIPPRPIAVPMALPERERSALWDYSRGKQELSKTFHKIPINGNETPEQLRLINELNSIIFYCWGEVAKMEREMNLKELDLLRFICGQERDASPVLILRNNQLGMLMLADIKKDVGNIEKTVRQIEVYRKKALVHIPKGR